MRELLLELRSFFGTILIFQENERTFKGGKICFTITTVQLSINEKLNKKKRRWDPFYCTYMTGNKH